MTKTPDKGEGVRGSKSPKRDQVCRWLLLHFLIIWPHVERWPDRRHFGWNRPDSCPIWSCWPNRRRSVLCQHEGEQLWFSNFQQHDLPGPYKQRQ